MANFYTTNTLIESITRRAMIPISENTFTEKDFLAFINEEMDIGLVPHILSFHEDYLLYKVDQKLMQNNTSYTIPYRSIGNKLRDVFYRDNSGTLFELTRVLVEDIPYFQYGSLGATSNSLRAFYMQGDQLVILANDDYSGLNGSLNYRYYLRPNTLVSEDRVARITSVDYNKGLITVDQIPANFSGETVFDITSCKNPHRMLAMDITPNSLATTSNLTYTFGTIRQESAVIVDKAQLAAGSYFWITNTVNGSVQNDVFWLDLTGSDPVPAITQASLHRVDISTVTTANDIAVDLAAQINLVLNPFIKITTSGATLIISGGGPTISVGENFHSSSNFTYVTADQIGTNTLVKDMRIGDVFALSEETIIPQVPSELHSVLAQRVAIRCLEALGDTQGLTNAMAKLQEMETKTGSLIDNRVEGANLKVTNRHSFLNQTRRYIRR